VIHASLCLTKDVYIIIFGSVGANGDQNSILILFILILEFILPVWLIVFDTFYNFLTAATILRNRPPMEATCVISATSKYKPESELTPVLGED